MSIERIIVTDLETSIKVNLMNSFYFLVKRDDNPFNEFKINFGHPS